MDKKEILALIEEFSRETHGRTDYDKDTVFVMGNKSEEYAPLKFLSKSIPDITSPEDLLEMGYIYSSYDHSEGEKFKNWYEKQFQRKTTLKALRSIHVLYDPNQVEIFNSLETIFKNYEVLREANIIINGKNLPVQVGEWYAKGIFGLKQVKSTSQRGFDFQLDGKRVEVRVHWSDSLSQKGMKIKKSSVELSDWIILMYVSSNFMIRDICLLDSAFVRRKFSGKGHTIFLKDSDIGGYYFSRSDKHFDKVVNKNALMKFASPYLAVKLSERI